MNTTMNDNNINSNEVLYQFVEDGPIWEILSNLSSENGTRYRGYITLLGTVGLKDAEALDKFTDGTGQALYLAESLVGTEVFWTTVKAVIRNSIKLDAGDGDLTATEAKKLLELLQAV